MLILTKKASDDFNREAAETRAAMEISPELAAESARYLEFLLSKDTAFSDYDAQ